MGINMREAIDGIASKRNIDIKKTVLVIGHQSLVIGKYSGAILLPGNNCFHTHYFIQSASVLTLPDIT
jgi:hypothetical protein